MSATDRPVLPRDLAGTVAQAGVDPTLEGHALQDALRAAIATRRGSCSWDVDHASWVVTLHSPEEQDVFGKTLEEALTHAHESPPCSGYLATFAGVGAWALRHVRRGNDTYPPVAGAGAIQARVRRTSA